MKINVRYLMSLFAVFILLSFNSLAYDNTTLQKYFTMGDAGAEGYNTSTVYDSKTGEIYEVAGTYDLFGKTGKVGNALWSGYSGYYISNSSFSGYDNTDWSVNVWVEDDNGGGANVFYLGITGTASAYDYLILVGNQTQYNSMNYYVGSPAYNHIICNISVNSNVWNMFTWIYHKNNGQVDTYLNGVFCDSDIVIDDLDFGDKGFKIVWSNQYLSLDELSFWYYALNSSDIAILYNSGNGLNYAETLASGSGFVAQNYSENQTNGTEENFTQPVNSTIFTNNTFKVGNGYFSSIQCIDNPVNPQLDSYCNNTIYGDYGAGLGFYCDLDQIFPCSTNKTCMTYVADLNTSDELTFNLLKDCTTIQSTYQRFNFRCSYIESTSLYLPFLHDYIYTSHNINCSLFDTYSISSTTCTGEETWDWIADGRENDTFYSTGQCVDASGALGCYNQCSPNDYRCGDIKNSLICEIQSDGCYDWSLNTVCSGTDICKSSSGLCGPLITNNTCSSTSDCAIGQNCCNGECISGTCSTTPETSGECGFLCGDGLKQSTKYVIVIIILMVIIGVFTTIGFQVGNGMMGFTIGTVFSFFGLIVFTALGWIPAWIMILLILLSVAVIVLVGLNKGE